MGSPGNRLARRSFLGHVLRRCSCRGVGRDRQREKLVLSMVTTEVLAPLGSTGAGEALQQCPKLRQGSRSQSFKKH